LLGRLDRVVKIEEKRLSLPEMEARLALHHWVEAAAVVPLSGRRQTLGAALVLNAEGKARLAAEGRRSIAQALQRHLADHFEAVLLPRHWRFTDRLPATDRGKISYATVVALFVPASAPPLLPGVTGVTHERDSLGQQVILDLHVSPKIAHFAGHFAGAALVPGVVQVDWAVHFARQYLPLEGAFSALENLKFLGVMVPDAKLQLSLAWDAQRKRLDFSYANPIRKFSVGRVVFGAAQ
jgi:3-hydroxymyristoyl/3-hydroxydecanoyl-(acyl carrier protein) dehydratase